MPASEARAQSQKRARQKAKPEGPARHRKTRAELEAACDAGDKDTLREWEKKREQAAVRKQRWEGRQAEAAKSQVDYRQDAPHADQPPQLLGSMDPNSPFVPPTGRQQQSPLAAAGSPLLSSPQQQQQLAAATAGDILPPWESPSPMSLWPTAAAAARE